MADYSTPVLGLIFLRFADHKFAQGQKDLNDPAGELSKYDYQAAGVLYVPPDARYDKLVALPESADVAGAINNAMDLIMAENEDLKGVLPKTYRTLDRQILVELLRDFQDIPADVTGDLFGRIYEYFLGKFASQEGQRGGEFFTPTTLVQLIVAIIEPYHGYIYDPACGVPRSIVWQYTNG